MKKITILLLAILPLLGCKKQDPEQKEEGDTTYSLEIDTQLYKSIQELVLDEGYTDVQLDLVFNEYYNKQRVQINSVRDISDAYVYSFTATERTEYITVRLDVECIKYGTKKNTITLYIANVIYLNKGSNTMINFNPSTYTSSSEPH